MSNQWLKEPEIQPWPGRGQVPKPEKPGAGTCIATWPGANVISGITNDNTKNMNNILFLITFSATRMKIKLFKLKP